MFQSINIVQTFQKRNQFIIISATLTYAMKFAVSERFENGELLKHTMDLKQNKKAIEKKNKLSAPKKQIFYLVKFRDLLYVASFYCLYDDGLVETKIIALFQTNQFHCECWTCPDDRES